MEPSVNREQVGYYYADNCYNDWNLVMALAALAKASDPSEKATEILNEIIQLAQKNLKKE